MDDFPTLRPIEKKLKSDAVLELPDVKSYLDVRLFLQDVYAYRKQKDVTFSYQVWADELEIASKSYLRFAIVGRRKISPELVTKFCKFLFQNESDYEYFTLLVCYSQADDPIQKKIFGRKLISFLKSKEDVQEINLPDLCKSPMAVMVRNVLTFADAVKDEKSLSHVFDTDPKKMKSVLASLHAAGWIEKDENSSNPLKEEIKGAVDHWIATKKVIKIADSPQDPSIAFYHENSLKTALLQASLIPVNERSFRSLGLALSAAQYGELMADWDEFVRALFLKYDSELFFEKRMYQINFNLFPWTKKANPEV